MPFKQGLHHMLMKSHSISIFSIADFQGAIHQNTLFTLIEQITIFIFNIIQATTAKTTLIQILSITI